MIILLFNRNRYLFSKKHFYVRTKILQKSGIQKNEVIELIYRGFI